MRKEIKTPVLDALIAAGIVRTDGFEYFGRAPDGVELTLGCVLKPKDLIALEAWLTENPPNNW